MLQPLVTGPYLHIHIFTLTIAVRVHRYAPLGGAGIVKAAIKRVHTSRLKLTFV